jgi:signal transduction histidine kinase
VRVKIQYKFLLGIVLGMILVFLVSFTTFMELRPTHSIEFQIQPLIVDILNIHQTEVNALVKYATTRDATAYEKWAFTSRYFTRYIDSLIRIDGNQESRNELHSILRTNKDLREAVTNRHTTSRMAPDENTEAQWKTSLALLDSIGQHIREYEVMHRPPLATALKQYQDQQENYGWAIGVIVLFIVFIALGIAPMFASSMTKPIRALRAGTLKVGEGQYETVDVTSNDEVADLTRAFNLMSDKLRKLDEMRMQMMSEISHEMRTPLQVIKAGCYSIIHAKDGPQLTQRQRDAVGMIHQATNRINNFVNSFLDIAKMEAGLMKFNFQMHDLVEIVTPLIQEAQLIAQTRQIVLFSHADSLAPMLLDKERLGQAFSNLLSNALKYTPDNGKITVNIVKVAGTSSESINGKDTVRIEVQDSGVGIPEADLSRLFSKFFQANNVPLVNEKGSGLGLALVKHVSEAHGGHVGVTSQVGSGSTFTIVIPINAERS